MYHLHMIVHVLCAWRVKEFLCCVPTVPGPSFGHGRDAWR
jgi:hypothetical protein